MMPFFAKEAEPTMHVVITGASAGIGEATAHAYARRGADVSLVARREDRLRSVAAEVERLGGRAAVFVADVGSREACEGALDDAVAAFGPVDLLVNNAGMPAGASFTELSVDEIERVMDVNFLSAVWFTRAAVPSMVDRRAGAIVFVASIAGKIGVPRAGAYCASKHAMVGFAEALAVEMRARGVRVVCINPGPVRTESFPHRLLPRRLVLEPDAIARALVRAVDRGTPERMIPRYYALAPLLRALAPPLYRRALQRFSARTPDQLSSG